MERRNPEICGRKRQGDITWSMLVCSEQFEVQHFASDEQNPDPDKKENSTISFTITKPVVRCSECNEEFVTGKVSLVSLCDHLMLKHELPLYACDWCKNISGDSLSLQYHMLTEHGKDVGAELQCNEDELKMEYEVDPYSTHCLLCRKVYPDSVELREHVSSHLEDAGLINVHKMNQIRHKGVQIDDHHATMQKEDFLHPHTLSDSEQLEEKNPAQPMVEVHGDNRQFICSVCSKKFKSTKNLNEHVRFLHEKRWSHMCQTCERGFRTRPELKHHNQLHHGTGEQQYSCTSCTFSLNSELSLRRHVRDVHLGQDKGTICQVCGRQLKRRESMKRHLQTVHNMKDNDEEPILCSMCGKVFREKSSLNKHNREVHTNSFTQFRCDTCGKTFKRRHGLTQHTLSHKEEKPLGCVDCGATFKYSSNYYNHMQIKHGIHVKRKFQNTDGVI